ncbi:tripartite tricarboxylate transporter TctB family protein [Nocardioides sp. zg-1228]|uniref:tripartite tricarboxylate transporter TctB family protein n=1 Tax=Nocardioides sp. zg-1228 TaxID=2763008 RepID=UPI0016434932|nr:tripartite tricarboxylate transporter TctB family protein [Nocardioides sp. zg-1228]MBC2933324.1 tripartite tricarboxylate transporter TctB family protein [Nocardioides sp. zg-1228]QSF56517.1 tripartite tricarboxylate transporter TctB family protein [Nocardioides sp. zg-1228]
MSTSVDTPTPAEAPRTALGRDRDLPQLGLAALLVVVGAYTFYDATTLRIGFGDPVGPRIFPYVIGAVTVVLGLLLVVATLRGDVPQAEGGEDVDLRHPADWVTVLKLVGVLLFTALTVSFLGWAVSGALLFTGAAWSLGSRTLLRDAIVGTVLSVSSWYFFHEVLGVILPAGILDGVL